MTAPTAATAPAAQSAHQQEKTFRNYTASDAAKYLAYRGTYPPALINLVLDLHTSTGGQTTQLLDVGCGPGIATGQLASHFHHVAGVDAGESMIEAAQAQASTCLSSMGEPASFKVCNSEDIDKHFEPESVDLITVATAAHWFDMPKFYVAAAKVLKSGGSIAMWCGSSWWVDPRTTPNAENVQAAWLELEREILLPFEMPGNKLVRELYRDLDMPWTIEAEGEAKQALDSFDRELSVRREFNADGQPDPDPMFAETNGYLVYRHANVGMLSKGLGTASPVTRWREAHKEQLDKGEIEDCVSRMLRLMRERMWLPEEGFEERFIDCGVSNVLVVLKKRA